MRLGWTFLYINEISLLINLYALFGIGSMWNLVGVGVALLGMAGSVWGVKSELAV